MSAPFNVWRRTRFYDRAASFVSASRKRQHAAEQALHQINVVGEHSEQLVAIEPERLAVPGDRRAPSRGGSGQRVGDADRGAGGASSVPATGMLQQHFALDDLIDGRRRADVEEHGAGFQRHFRGDGGQRQQLRRGCSRQQRILTQEARGSAPRPGGRDPATSGEAAEQRGRAVHRWRGAVPKRLCASSTLSDTIVRKSSAAMRKQTVGSSARTVLRSAVPCSTSSKPMTAGGTICGAGRRSIDRSTRRPRAGTGHRRPALPRDRDRGRRDAGSPRPPPRCGTARRPTATRTAESRGRGRRARRSAATRSPRLLTASGCAAPPAPTRRPRSPRDRSSDRCVATYVEIVGERPELSLADEVDRRRRDDRVVIVHELRERVLEVARPALEHERSRSAPCRPAACRRGSASRACAPRRRAGCRGTRRPPRAGGDSPCSIV